LRSATIQDSPTPTRLAADILLVLLLDDPQPVHGVDGLSLMIVSPPLLDQLVSRTGYRFVDDPGSWMVGIIGVDIGFGVGVGVGVGVGTQVQVPITNIGMIGFWRGEETLKTAESADGLPFRHAMTITKTVTMTITAFALALAIALALAVAPRLQLEIHEQAGELKAPIQVGYSLRRGSGGAASGMKNARRRRAVVVGRECFHTLW
jgi:hypothetical protein